MTRSIRSRFQDSRPELPPDDDGSRRGLNLFGWLGLAALIVAMGGLSIWWMMSDFSGEYFADDSKLGAVTFDLNRRATNVDGTLTMPGGTILEIVSGRVSNNNQLDLAFAPKDTDDSGQRYITATFSGLIDPPTVEQGSTTLSFDKVLNPFPQKDDTHSSGIAVPWMELQGKVIKGQFTYNGITYDLTLQRSSLTSVFHWLKSFWPGGR